MSYTKGLFQRLPPENCDRSWTSSARYPVTSRGGQGQCMGGSNTGHGFIEPKGQKAKGKSSCYFQWMQGYTEVRPLLRGALKGQGQQALIAGKLWLNTSKKWFGIATESQEIGEIQNFWRYQNLNETGWFSIRHKDASFYWNYSLISYHSYFSEFFVLDCWNFCVCVCINIFP